MCRRWNGSIWTGYWVSRNERYFVLHAPRQTGKTSTLLALRDLLNSGAEGVREERTLGDAGIVVWGA